MAFQDETHNIIATKKAGNMNVYTMGDLTQESRPNILTVHDMGSNHKSWWAFLSHPAMVDVKQRCNFIHVNVPGQEDGAAKLPADFHFPSMDELAESLVEVLDQLKVQLVVGLGEGAGANILARFAMSNPNRVYGLVLVHCTSTKAGVMEYFKDKIINWKLESGMNQTAEEYLVFHKFGNQLEQRIENAGNKEAKEKLIKEFAENLKSNINHQNLRLFVECFRSRKEIASRLMKELSCDTLLVTGAKASHVHTVHTMHQNCRKDKVQLLKLDNVGDVITEATEVFARSFLLFLKGCGLLSTVLLPGQMRSLSGSFSRNRSMSMEEADKPRDRRYSDVNLLAASSQPQP